MAFGGQSLEELLTSAFDGLARGLRVAQPARVLAFDSTTRTVRVQPLLMTVYEDEPGERVTEEHAPINGVPVVYPCGGRGARIYWPLAAGDTVLLVFCDTSIDKFKIRGGVVDPVDTRHHHPSDAVAFPCELDRAHAESDDVAIEFTAASGGQIHAGGSSSLTKQSDYASHTHPYSWTDSAGSGVTGGPTPAGSGTAIFKAGIVFAGWVVAAIIALISMGA